MQFACCGKVALKPEQRCKLLSWGDFTVLEDMGVSYMSCKMLPEVYNELSWLRQARGTHMHLSAACTMQAVMVLWTTS